MGLYAPGRPSHGKQVLGEAPDNAEPKRPLMMGNIFRSKSSLPGCGLPGSLPGARPGGRTRQ